MPCRVWISYCLAVFASTPLAAEDAEAAAVVRRAIQAAGGAERLAKFPAGRLTAKGNLFEGANTIPVTAEQAFQIPGRMRTFMQLESKGQKVEVLHIVNGEKATLSMNGSPVPITEPARKELHAAMLSLEIGQLTPLLADSKRFTLKMEKPARDADPDRIGVIVSVKGGGEFRLAFDKASGHLVRLARKAFDSATGKDADQEQVFSGYKEFGGLLRPTKVVLFKDGKKTLELTTESFTPLNAIEAKEFVTE